MDFSGLASRWNFTLYFLTTANSHQPKAKVKWNGCKAALSSESTNSIFYLLGTTLKQYGYCFTNFGCTQFGCSN